MSATETEQAKQKVERELVFSILAALTQFPESGTLVIATLRSDFLPDLFAYEGLYDVAKKGLDLRKMTEEDLEAAIKQPLLHLNKQSNTHVIFEPDLIKKLVIDTVSDPAYLPLLQVTLEDLWKRGSLRLAHYYGIAEAFQRHADQVHKNTRDQHGQIVGRPKGEPENIIRIFLELVEVALDDNARRDVRRPRRTTDLTKDNPDRIPLINELSSARLLTKRVEQLDQGEVEVVDIIHESLIVNWEPLKKAIGLRRESLQQRARFEDALKLWIQHNRVDRYLLTDVRLEDAQVLQRDDDIALRSMDAREFLRRGIMQREARQQTEIRRTRRFAAGLGILLMLALAAMGIALQETGIRRGAEAQERHQREVAQTAEAQERHQREVAQTAEAQEQQQREIAQTAEALTPNFGPN